MLGNCLGAAVLSCFILAGCKSDEDKSGSAADSEERAALEANEDALLGKRDELFNMRRSLQKKRADLLSQREEIRQASGDTSEIDKQFEQLAKQEKDIDNQDSELIRSFREFASQRREITAALSGGGPGGQVAAREAGVAGRERQLAKRESQVAAREAAVSQREEGLASKWKETCSAGSVQTVIRTVDTKGSTYTKKDVEPLLAKARREMSKKGLLFSDLPEQAKGLEREANDGIKEGDYGRARLAASQLVNTVRAIKINKAFIAAKIARLNQRIGGKRLNKATEGLFREATAYYGDAKFGKANNKLNQISSSLR